METPKKKKKLFFVVVAIMLLSFYLLGPIFIPEFVAALGNYWHLLPVGVLFAVLAYFIDNKRGGFCGIPVFES